MLAPRRGRDVLDAWDFWREGGSLADRAEWIGVLQARSIAGGAIPADDYALLRAEILAGLVALVAEAPLDGLVLDIHGAASVVGLDDMEGDLAVAVRAVVGADCLISSGMDLHGNVSRTLAETVDLLTTYRTAPHVDWQETKERAARNLVDRLALPLGPAASGEGVGAGADPAAGRDDQHPAGAGDQPLRPRARDRGARRHPRRRDLDRLPVGRRAAQLRRRHGRRRRRRPGPVRGDRAGGRAVGAPRGVRLRGADRDLRRGAGRGDRLAGRALLHLRLRRQPDRGRRRRRDLDARRAARQRGAGGERQARDLRLDPRRDGCARRRRGRRRGGRTPHARRAGRRPARAPGGGVGPGGRGGAERGQPRGRRPHAGGGRGR